MRNSDNISKNRSLYLSRYGTIAFLVLTLCILVLSLVFYILSLGKPYMGITLSNIENSWEVTDVDPNGLAIHSGITAGDKPTEINGQPARIFLEKYNNDGIVLGIVIKEITVINEANQIATASLHNGKPSEQTLNELIIFFIITLIFWLIGFYVFFKKPRETISRLFCLCGLFFGLAITANAAAEREIPSAFWFAVTAFAIGPWLLAHFFLILPEERTHLRENPKLYLMYLPAIIVLALFPLVGYSNGQTTPWFRNIRLLEIGIGFVFAASVAFLNFFKSESIRTKQQMKIVLFSCVFALLPIVIFYILPEVIWSQNSPITSFSIILISLIPLGLGYAILTQGLLDISVFIRRSLIYGLITLIMASFFTVVIFIVLRYPANMGTIEKIFVAICLGGIGTVLFGPLKRYIELFIDRVFYKDRYDYRQTIEVLSNSLKSIDNYNDASRVIVGTLASTLNLSGTCLLMKTDDSLEVSAAHGIFIDKNEQNRLKDFIMQGKPLTFPNIIQKTELDLAYLVPLTFEDKQLGILCLSNKASKQRYSNDDIFLIQGTASIATLALRSAIIIRDFSIKNTFVSVASHELRTPLTAIMGYAELLMRHEASEANRKRLQHIINNSQRITNMADELLNVSRIQSDKVILKLENLTLSEILVEQMDLAKELTEIHEFSLDIDSNLPDIKTDHDKLSQVIANLLSNAVKYSPNGGRILISAHFDQSRNAVITSVSDEGIGISPEDQKLLFTTFHRIQRPETHSIRGIGLGLFIAKEWTEAMGGKIWVESELNKGSAFFIMLPI